MKTGLSVPSDVSGAATRLSCRGRLPLLTMKESWVVSVFPVSLELMLVGRNRPAGDVCRRTADRVIETMKMARRMVDVARKDPRNCLNENLGWADKKGWFTGFWIVSLSRRNKKDRSTIPPTMPLMTREGLNDLSSVESTDFTGPVIASALTPR